MLNIQEHRENAMKIKLLGLIIISTLIGCEPIEHVSEEQVSARTMIIGGVPVHDKDYKLADAHQSLNEVQANSSP